MSEIEEIVKELESKFGAEVKKQRDKRHWVKINRENLIDVCTWLKEKGFDHLSSVVGVDYPENFEVVYHLWSYSLKELISLKVPVPKDDPKIQSVTSIWRGANWHERETAEMFGITFEGHPDPRKLLLPDDFEGYPLRKDFKLKPTHWLGKEEEEEKDVQA